MDVFTFRKGDIMGIRTSGLKTASRGISIPSMLMLTSVSVGFMVGLAYLYFSAPMCMEWCEATHDGILTGTALAPYRFRLLGAWFADLIPAGSVAFQYALAHLIVMPTVFALLGAWLRDTVGHKATFGVYLFAAYYLVFMYLGVFGMSTQVELLFLLAGMMYLKRRGADTGYAMLVLVGTLNRETTGILLIVLAFPHGLLRNGVAFGLVFVALRVLLGAGTGSESVLDIVRGNMNPTRLSLAVFNHLPFIPVVLMTMAGWRGATQEVRRRVLLVGVIYIPLVLVFGYWDEVRLWEPLILMALPVMAADVKET